MYSKSSDSDSESVRSANSTSSSISQNLEFGLTQSDTSVQTQNFDHRYRVNHIRSNSALVSGSPKEEVTIPKKSRSWFIPTKSSSDIAEKSQNQRFEKPEREEDARPTSKFSYQHLTLKYILLVLSTIAHLEVNVSFDINLEVGFLSTKPTLR